MKNEKQALRIYPNMIESILKLPIEEQDVAFAALVRKGFGLPMQPLSLMQDLATAAILPLMELKGLQGAPKGNKNARKTINKNNFENNIELNDKTILKQSTNKEKIKQKTIALKAETESKINLKIYTKEKLEIDNDFIAEPFKEPFIRWLKYKKARKELYANADSLMACYNKLLKESNNDPLIADAMIEAAIGNNYQGFFPLRNTPTKTQGEVKEWLKY